MAEIRYGDVRVTLQESETVLEGLLRAGIELASSCRAGSCQSCLARALEGSPPAASQVGLKESLVQKGYFLPCVARPDGDLEVGPPADDDVAVPGRVAEVEPLSETVSRVRVLLDRPFEYRPGQFVNVVRQDGLVRSYSVASLPEAEEGLELHVRRIAGGRMSNWLCGPDAVGSAVEVRGPAGDCFYLGDTEEALVLVGTGTGLAPLYGVARDALRRGHRGAITLYHGALSSDGLYLHEELGALQGRHENFDFRPCVLNGDPENGVLVGAIDEIVFERHPDLAAPRFYLCGDPGLVNGLRRQLFIQGASLKRIHADAFVMSPD